MDEINKDGKLFGTKSYYKDEIRQKKSDSAWKVYLWIIFISLIAITIISLR